MIAKRWGIRMDNISQVVDRLEKKYIENIENDSPTSEEIRGFKAWVEYQELDGIECWFCPDKSCYNFVLKNVSSEDVVMDIGSGDLRLPLLLSEKVKKVYAVEVNPKIVGDALKAIGYNLPRNVIVYCANILDIKIPSDVTIVTILMRHCLHQEEFLHKFKESTVMHNFNGRMKMII